MGESIVMAARHKMMGQQHHGEGAGPDLLVSSRRLIEQLKKVCNDNAMGKRENHIRMSQRWSTLYRMSGLQLVIPTHANLTAAPPEDGGAMRDYEPFSESSVFIDGWLDACAALLEAPPLKRHGVSAVWRALLAANVLLC